MIADFDGDITAIIKDGKECDCPILTTRNMVVMPGVVVPIMLGREASVNVARYLDKDKDKRVCAIMCQKNPDKEYPDNKEDLYDMGVMARLVRIIELPSSNAVTAIFQATTRCRLEKITSKRAYLKGHVQPVPEHVPAKDDTEYKSIADNVRSSNQELIRMDDDIPDEGFMGFINIEDNTMLINFACTNLPFSVEDKIDCFELMTCGSADLSCLN